MLKRQCTRHGVTAVECSLIFPLAFMFLAGTIICGIGVFRYQEIAALAREAARYASVRGSRYEFDSGNWTPTADQIYQDVILPRAVSLDTKQLTYSVTWTPDNRQGGLVTVQLNYYWIPEAFLGGVQFSSTSTMMISY